MPTSISARTAILAVALLAFATSGAPVPCAAEPEIELERVSTAVPWPRGLVFDDGQLVVLARGRHRVAGGPDPAVEDHAGTLFVVDPNIAEPVVSGVPAGAAVSRNGRLLARPTEPPFRLWDPSVVPPVRDRLMDRPYCALAWDPESRNFFVCAFSGVDMPDSSFRKNATDAIHRYDRRTERWYPVESHQPAPSVARAGEAVPNSLYPHHDPISNPPPHGWLNGPNSLAIAGSYLYAVGKDNSALVQYELDAIRRSPGAPPPTSRRIFEQRLVVSEAGRLRELQVVGHSALAVHDGFLYVGFRTSSEVIRLPLDADGDVASAGIGEVVARFRAGDGTRGTSADVVDIAFDPDGRLFVSTSRDGRVWRIGEPDVDGVYDATAASTLVPYVDLRVLTDDPEARVGNIAFDEAGRLYLCSGNYDTDSPVGGVIYRATELDRSAGS